MPTSKSNQGQGKSKEASKTAGKSGNGAAKSTSERCGSFLSSSSGSKKDSKQ